jgi:hypothetical protein
MIYQRPVPKNRKQIDQKRRAKMQIDPRSQVAAQPHSPGKRDIWKAKDALGLGKKPRVEMPPDSDLISFLNSDRGLNVLTLRDERLFRNFVNNNKTHDELCAELCVSEIGLYEYVAGLRLQITDVKNTIPGVIPRRTPAQIRWLQEEAAIRAEDEINRKEELKFVMLTTPTSVQIIEKHEPELNEACELLAKQWWDKPADKIRNAVEEATDLLHKAIDRRFINPVTEQPERIVRYLDLRDHIKEKLKAKIPNHHCAHGYLWSDACDVCEKVSASPVNTGDQHAVNLLLSRLGFGKWAGYSKLCSYVGGTTNDGKLIDVDAAIQRDRSFGGKRGKPKGIGPDSDAAHGEDNGGGQQASSAPDPNYAGKRRGPDYPRAAGEPVEGFNPQTPSEPRDLEPVALFDQDPEEANEHAGTSKLPEPVPTGPEAEPELPTVADLVAGEAQKRGRKVDADLF